MKRPAFQFYPADWRKDPALSSCSLAARGLWIELMCIAHESDRYGHLSVNGRAMDAKQIARMVGESPAAVAKLLAELEAAAVFSRGEDGVIYSRRMVKDEHIRDVRAAAGKKGGNPNLVGGLLKQTGEQKPTPSSSSSSSSSKHESSDEDSSPEPLAPVATGNPAAGSGDLPVVPNCPVQRIVDAYHAELPMLPRVRALPDAAERMLRTRWREDQSRQTVEWWREFFVYVRGCPFLVGAKTDFTADLLWIVRPVNFAKIVNGNFEEKTA